MALASYVAIAILSYLQAPALWTAAYYPNASQAFQQLYGPENYSAILAFFDGPLAVLLSRWIPVIVASAAMIGVIALVRNLDRRMDNILAPRILLWSLVFTAAAFFAYPLYTQDLWLSALWGDMVASGINPYHVTFTGVMESAYPLDHFPMTMSYGPLWALLSGLIMLVTGGSLIASFLLFKIILTAAWCATLFLVDRLARDFAPGRRSLALAITGWLPLGVLETVAEGHNDVILVMPVLLWLALLIGRKLTSPLALGVSVLSKYSTALLFLADALYTLRQEHMPFRQYCLRMILPALMFFGLMAIFYRSFAFFDGVRLIGTWHFMHPDDAFKVVSAVLGDWITPAGKALLLIFPAIAAWQCWQYWKAPSNEMLMRVVLSIMCAVSFSVVGHLWPWYLVWTLPLAALVPQWWLSRFVVGMCLVAPFLVIVWWVPEAEELNNVAA
ncbi:MAG TPA: hypothetical protein VKA94_14260, partial [Hyphomicrobiales bacterium]|nr:hypothetical protein [Hyphomicrobiales bacterium]